MKKISAYFDDSIKNNILNSPVINANLEYTMCSTHTPNADCTTKNAYKTLVQEIQDCSLRREALFWIKELLSRTRFEKAKP